MFAAFPQQRNTLTVKYYSHKIKERKIDKVLTIELKILLPFMTSLPAFSGGVNFDGLIVAFTAQALT